MSLLESNLLTACTSANRNILRLSALWQKQVSWNMCVNMEWIVCAARGSLPKQSNRIQFAVPPSRINPDDHDHFRKYKTNILRWSANYEIDYISWSFYAVELCLIIFLCDNHEEFWSLGRDDFFTCSLSENGRERFVEALELLIVHQYRKGFDESSGRSDLPS